jgi:CheY-like chemotaxis protein
MARIRLIHWNADEAMERAHVLEWLGHEVEAGPFDPRAFDELKLRPPDAFVVDLSRIPSQGRDVGILLRSSPVTRPVPLIFVEGDPEKVEGVRALLPDATFATYLRIAEALRHALAKPIESPVVHRSRLAGYSGTPLPKKLGIKPGSVVVLVGAPRGFEGTLGELPDAARITRRLPVHSDLVLWFVRSKRDVGKDMKRMVPRAEGGGLWILWTKRASGIVSDVSEKTVRASGLAAGLVDFKVASIDATWSGLRFSRRARKKKA